MCSDMLMRSSHFPVEMSYRQIGQKVVAVNVSDLAAMGADAVGIIISMGLPKTMLVEEFDDLVDGILEACDKYGMALIGGDTNEAAELTLNGTCIGTVQKENVLMRSGALPGDILAVTGDLGLAAAGFEILGCDCQDKLNEDSVKISIKHALEPEARLKEGKILSNNGHVSSATDISDGLLSELGEIIDANESAIGITVHENWIPIPSEVFEIAEITHKNPYDLALSYGEDFELLLTISPLEFESIKTKLQLIKIGFVDSTGTIKMVDKSGDTKVVTPKGYEHLN
ncbi:MAG: thiamine-phosphate kinase [Methanobacterium sp. ERen5]|nr:MAG: thiamine-phosphate kinase [Methanobacterium sp. ERen5]